MGRWSSTAWHWSQASSARLTLLSNSNRSWCSLSVKRAGQANKVMTRVPDNWSSTTENKTEKLPKLRSDLPENKKERRKSFADINPRKPSFLENVSSLLNYIKQN